MNLTHIHKCKHNVKIYNTITDKQTNLISNNESQDRNTKVVSLSVLFKVHLLHGVVCLMEKKKSLHKG